MPWENIKMFDVYNVSVFKLLDDVIAMPWFLY